MKKIYILPVLAAGLLSVSCSKEHPFDREDGNGEVLKSALAVDIDAAGLENQRSRTRAVDADINDFTVIFTKEGNSQPVAKYKYGEMPEVVSLPAGTYTCTATYGENRQAEWDSPYFLGVSQSFEVTPYEITSYIDPIVCHLENIKVTVDFDAELRSRMSDDSYVEVKVGSSSALNYGLAEADAQKAGFFMHSEEITLVAVFHGKIDGVETVETKSLRDIEKGNHYKITFKLHSGSGGTGSGDVSGDVSVDASVTVVDVTRNVPLGDETLLDDSERPNEGGGEDPGQDPKEDAPTITAESPVNLDIVNQGASLTTCILNIHSSAEGGLTGLTCDIESPTLTPEELSGFGLSSHLDLVNTPEDQQSALSGLGFPVLVGGQKDVKFEITGMFLGLLGGLGEGEHHFVITATDANGTTTKTLKIAF